MHPLTFAAALLVVAVVAGAHEAKLQHVPLWRLAWSSLAAGCAAMVTGCGLALGVAVAWPRSAPFGQVVTLLQAGPALFAVGHVGAMTAILWLVNRRAGRLRGGHGAA
ncbi:MAG: hypothetical protein ACK4N5_25105, partial [Myxococcales bacterium]